MKIKAAVIGGPDSIAAALSSRLFAQRVLQEVVGDALGVSAVLQRPAEYYVQNADQGPSPDPEVMGVEVRLTGASRNGRTPKQFHRALRTLEGIVESTVLEALCAEGSGLRCQIFCVLMADDDIETRPGSGVYSSVIEGDAFFAGQRKAGGDEKAKK